MVSRTKNSFRNLFFGFLNKIVMLLFPFIIRTIMIKQLGSEYLGLNSLFSSILQVLNLAELGFGSAVVYSMYKPVAENDTKTICALLNLYKKIYKKIGVFIALIGIFLLPFVKYLINGSYPTNINIYIIFTLYIINTSLTYFLFVYKSSLFIAHQRHDVVSNILTITSMIQYFLQVIVLIFFKNYYLFLIVSIFSTVLNNLLISYFSKKKYPELSAEGTINQSTKKDIKKRVTGLMVQRVCSVSRNSFDSIFISAFLGLNIVAIYTNYFTIMNAVIGILGIISTAILASVGNSIVTETKEKNYNDLTTLNFIYMWISGFCTICLCCLYQPFMEIWMGESMLLPFNYVLLLCIYFYILKMGDIRSIYVDAKGLWWENRLRAILEAVLNIVLNYILGYFFGLFGIILATIISLFFVNFIYGSQIIFKHYFTNVSVMDYFKKHLFYLTTTFFACIITYYFCSLINYNKYINFGIKALICIIFPNLIYLCIYYRGKQFKKSLSFIKKLKRSSKRI